MSSVLRTRIVKIGNSQGIRIPKPLLEHMNVGDEVELECLPDQIIIRPAQRARMGWETAFQLMAEHGDDQLLDRYADSATMWDEDEWEW